MAVHAPSPAGADAPSLASALDSADAALEHYEQVVWGDARAPLHAPSLREVAGELADAVQMLLGVNGHA